jgi:hypothetical protein
MRPSDRPQIFTGDSGGRLLRVDVESLLGEVEVSAL